MAGLGKPDMRGQGVEADAGGNVALVIEDWAPEAVKAEAASPCPAHAGGHAALLAVNDPLEAWHAMRHSMVADLNPDIAAAHFVGHRGRGSRADKRIEDPIPGLRRHPDDALDEGFGLFAVGEIDSA